MPYDPFIICNGVADKEVHLSFVETSFTGIVLDSDGFPWAILVPNDWSWPYENFGSSIYKAYPDFQGWYESSGESFENWYLTPVQEYVFDK
jgi:LruC domain-containing protein